MCGGAGKGTTFIGMNGKDHMLPEQLRLYSNLKEKRWSGVLGRGEKMKDGGGGGREERQGLGNKKTDEIKRQL